MVRDAAAMRDFMRVRLYVLLCGQRWEGQMCMCERDDGGKLLGRCEFDILAVAGLVV